MRKVDAVVSECAKWPRHMHSRGHQQNPLQIMRSHDVLDGLGFLIRIGARWLLDTISLARHLTSQRRRDEGCAMIADIYNWFTEGFDTADLKKPRPPLDELSR